MELDGSRMQLEKLANIATPWVGRQCRADREGIGRKSSMSLERSDEKSSNTGNSEAFGGRPLPNTRTHQVHKKKETQKDRNFEDKIQRANKRRDQSHNVAVLNCVRNALNCSKSIFLWTIHYLACHLSKLVTSFWKKFNLYFLHLF